MSQEPRPGRAWSGDAKRPPFTKNVISLLSIIAMGFFLGMRHATDPDHVIAVTTIVARQRSLPRAALVGAFWGVGHTLTIFVVGTAIILFKLVIPPRVGLSMELSVGIMLIVLGLMSVAGFLRSVPGAIAHHPDAESTVHSHPHSHGGYIHTHFHSHAPEGASLMTAPVPSGKLDRILARLNIYQHVRPLVVGIVHGLAGSAAVALLVLTTIQDSRWAIAYLLVFGFGTIAGMMVITLSIASTFKIVGRSQAVSRRLALASGLLSLAFGLVVAYQVCVVNGLLAVHPQWVPQ